jgi:hypothetical protein
MDIIKKTQFVAFILALLRADFTRPEAKEIDEILDMAKQQVQDEVRLSAMQEVPSASSN